MKTIYILNGHNTYNYWTFMMLINFIYYTYKISEDKNLKFVVDFLEENDLNRLQKELNNKEINIEILISKKNPPITNILGKFSKLFFMLFKFEKEILDYNPDTVVVLGWDDFSEYYWKLAIAIYMKIIIRLSKKVKLFFIGQTVWPFTTYNQKIAQELFSSVDITLRDTLCYNYMKDTLRIPTDKMKCFSDLAFLDLPLQSTIKTKEDYNLIDNEYITFIASWLYFKYTEDKELYVSELLKIISYLKEKFPSKKIVMLWHVLLPEVANDNNIINDIKEYLQDDERVIYIQEKLLSSEARSILSWTYLTLTWRMHAAISTLQTWKPAISLSYSVKYKWIISDDLWLPEMVVESKWHDKWVSWEVYNKTVESIDFIDNNYSEITTKIKTAVEKSKKLSIENIDYFIDNIK